jgi:hypothetical protein
MCIPPADESRVNDSEGPMIISPVNDVNMQQVIT